MSETKEVYAVREALTHELLLLLSCGQLAMLTRLLRDVRREGHGEICLEVDGNRLFITKTESYDGGILTKLQE